MTTSSLAALLSQLSPDSHVKGKQFERICKWYLQNDPVYSHELKRVWLWREWPGRWKESEAGIDLVAQARDGMLWAIQAKAYGDDNTVTKGDMDTFLSESARRDDKTGKPLFAYRLLITTSNKLAFHAQDVAKGSAIPVGIACGSNLEAAQVKWPALVSDLRAPRVAPKTARPHQLKAIDDVVNGFAASDRGQLIMACGTGKTLTALFIKEELAPRRALVLVPSLLLLRQWMNELMANRTSNFDFLPVCSDESVVDDEGILSATSELGHPATTDPERIAEFLLDDGTSTPRLVFATYHSSPQVAKAMTLADVPNFDLVIADEAHRCAGPLSSAFATVLDDKKIRAVRRLFMTAIPRNFSKRVLEEADRLGFHYSSQDDEAQFGPEFHYLSFRRSIDDGLLSDYHVHVIAVNDATYRAWAHNGQFITIDDVEVRDARSLAGQIGVAKAMHKYDLRRGITFHRLVNNARTFSESIPQVVSYLPEDERPVGAIWAKYADGDMTTGKRAHLLQQLRELGENERGLLANARCLTEGVDVPTLDWIAFIDPKRSVEEIGQAFGRVIRIDSNNRDKVGHVIIPVFIDPTDDTETALLSSAFEPVWGVIKAISAHDERLAEHLDTFRRQTGRLGKGLPQRLPGPITIDLPDTTGADFAAAFTLKLLQKTTASFEEFIGQMERFVEENGHALVPMTNPRSPLAKRVTTMRWLKSEGRLLPERVSRLDRLAGWEWNANEAAWQEGYRHAVDYRAKTGHALPKPKEMFNGFAIGQWFVVQRRAKDVMPLERFKLLQAIDGWTWSVRDTMWLAKLRRTQDGQPNATWEQTQRSSYRQGNLSLERIRMLEAIDGWEWEPGAVTRWAPEEDEIISRDGLTLVEVCQLLPGRTRGSIATRRTSLRRQRGDKMMRTWTPEEDAIVCQDGVPLRDLLIQLPGRTIRTVASRRSVLKKRDATLNGDSAS